MWRKSSYQREEQGTDADVDMGLAEEVGVRENLTGVDMKAGEQSQYEQPSEFSVKKGEIRELGDRWEGC